MNINKLFEIIQNKLSFEDLNGEFILQGNCIVWTYILDNYNTDNTRVFYNDDDEEELSDFSFESESSEELLLDSYNGDFQKIETLLDEIEETENWTFSDPEIIDDTIIFKLF